MTRLYTAYQRRAGVPDFYDDSGFTLVKDGFSWPAFLLAVPWALWHRMWAVATILAILQVVLGVLSGLTGLGEMTAGVLSFGMAVATGFAGTDIKGWSLRRKGYIATDVVVAENRDMAERRFLENHPQLAADMAAATRD